MSFFVFYIFATALILAQCEGILQEESDVPHAYTDVSNCRAHRVEIRNNRMKAALKPRESLVALKPGPGYEFQPGTVSVMRCDGFCPGHWSPEPTRSVKKRFIVHLSPKDDRPAARCVAVEVEEHLSCKCRCAKPSDECTPLQQFSSVSCACLCKDRDNKKSVCEAQLGRQWDDTDCTCQYNFANQECASGLLWNKNVSRCEPQ